MALTCLLSIQLSNRLAILLVIRNRVMYRCEIPHAQLLLKLNPLMTCPHFLVHGYESWLMVSAQHTANNAA